ncbi:MAG: FHA domain-containing protein [Bacteroidota bacterium]|nr:FHA domain-containing protein [Bacteroidota bacterium]
MKKKYAILVLLFLTAFHTYGQHIMQKGKVNTDSFPEIEFTINVNNPNIKTESDFAVSENLTPVDFSVQHKSDVNIEDESKAVLILFENMTHATHTGQRKYFQDILANSIESFVNPDDKVNIAVFDRNRNGETPLHFQLNNYIDKTDVLIREVRNIQPVNDYQSNNRSSDLYNAINDGVTDLIERFPNKNKIVLVFSAGYSLETSNEATSESVIAYARDNNVPIYSMQYMRWENRTVNRMAQHTYGKYHLSPLPLTDEKKAEAQDTLINYMNNAVERMAGQTYEFSYTSNVETDGGLNSIEVEVDNKEQLLSFTAPKCDILCQIFENKILLYGVIGGLLLIVILIIFLIKKNINKRKAENAVLEDRIESEKQNQNAALEKQQKELEDYKSESERKEQERIELEKQKAEKEKQEIIAEQKRRDEAEKEKQLIKEMMTNGFPILKIYGGGEGEFKIKKPLFSFGRQSSNDMVVDNKFISRNHFTIKYQNGNYIISDLNSTSGTIVNGKKIQTHTLKSNDHIQAGPVQFMFIK